MFTFGWHDVGLILFGMFSILIYELINWFLRRRKYRYKWKCKVCGFKVETNSPSTFQVSTTSHNHATLGEYKP